MMRDDLGQCPPREIVWSCVIVALVMLVGFAGGACAAWSLFGGAS